jgi:hypothetical protein
MKIASTVPRIPISRIPREVATRALFSKKLTNKSRKLFTNARSQVIDGAVKEPKSDQESFCAMLKRLTLVQLGGRANQLRKGIRRLERELEDTKLDTFRGPLEQALVMAKYRAGWVAGEIADRTFNPERIDETGN